MSTCGGRLPLRLETLSRDELLELAVAGCAASTAVAAQADALIARRKPLPAWCVEGVLLSPDLLQSILDQLPLSAVAAVCKTWAAAWPAQRKRRGYLNPEPALIETPGLRPHALAIMPDGAICLSPGDHSSLRFLTPEGEPMPEGSPWEALEAHLFQRPHALLMHEGALLVSDVFGNRIHRLRLSDGVEEAQSPVLGDELAEQEWGPAGPGRLEPLDLAVAGDRLFVPTREAIWVLDPRTLELRNSFGPFGDAVDVAVHNDELYVVDMARYGELAIYGLDGQHRRQLRGAFGIPSGIAIHEGRLYLLEYDITQIGGYRVPSEAWAGKRLIVLELGTGETHQVIRLPESHSLSTIAFRKGTQDEPGSVLFADHDSAVHFLRFY